jgi:hypothetical protein
MKNLHVFVLLTVLSTSVAFILFGCSSEPNFPPGLPSGEVQITVFGDPVKPGARFDFETGTVVYEPGAPVKGDIFFDRKFLCGSGYPLNVAIQDTQPQSIGADPSAPTTGYTSPNDTSGVPSRTGIYNSHVYWIKLTDGKYAKIKIKQSPLNEKTSDFEFIIFEWVYQPDGSTDFKGIPEEPKNP